MSLVAPHVGVLLWAWTALLPPTELLYGFMAGLPYNKLVAAITVVQIACVRRYRDIYLDATLVVLVLFGLCATVSSWGAIAQNSVTYTELDKLLKIIVLAGAICFVMTTRYRIHLMLVFLAFAYAFLGVKEALIFLLTAGGHKIVGTGSIGDNNSLATALLMLIPLLVYLARQSAAKLVRVAMAVTAALCVVTVVATFSRGGFVGLVVLGGFALVGSRRKLPTIAVIAATGFCIYLFAPANWFNRLETIQTAEQDSSFMGRVIAWKVNWLIAMDRPFFGGGMYAGQQGPVWNAYVGAAQRMDIVHTPVPPPYPLAAHSIYFQVIGDLGFVGFSLFGALAVLTLRNCLKLRRYGRSDPSLAWAGDLGTALMVSLIAYYVTGAALSLAYSEFFYILVALTSRCARTAGATVRQQLAGPAVATGGAWRDRLVAARSGRPHRATAT